MTLLVLALLACRSTPPIEPAPELKWTPFELGTYSRPIQTSSLEAQLAFDQGLVWAYAFNHDEAQRAFEEAARLDPDAAMPWWGVALVNGPNINNPAVDDEHARVAWAALQKATERTDDASPEEQALIGALAARYAEMNPADRAPLDAAYAAAMAGVYARFPKDVDVATLYAESLMDTRPWDQWTKDGQPQPGTAEVLVALDAALALDTYHPGANHLLIHAVEASPQPERGAEAADRLRALVPDASHLVHMPSHIDVRLGKWAEGAAANERAIEADVRYAARQPEIGFYRMYMAHDKHFLAYTAQMEGRRSVALAQTKAIIADLPPEKVREVPTFLDAFLTVEIDAHKRFGLWDELLALPAPLAEFPVATAHRHYARGIAFAAKGQLDDARKEREALLAALPAIPTESYWGSNSARAVVEAGVPYLDGEIAWREGKADEAVAFLTKAVEVEDALKYDEPPPVTVPARHALGAVLVAVGRHAEAEAVYRADLLKYPENGWALRGLAQALDGQGRKEEGAAVQARFEAAWARAEVPMESSCACVEALAE